MEKGDLLRATAAVIAGISIVWCLITCIWGWIWAAVVTILAFAVACAYVWLFVSGNKPHENEASFRRNAPNIRQPKSPTGLSPNPTLALVRSGVLTAFLYPK